PAASVRAGIGAIGNIHIHPPTLPGPPTTGRAGAARRRCLLEISQRVRAAGPLQREPGALRVGALSDPTPARHLNRTMDEFAPAVLDAGNSGVDVADVEIIEPARAGHIRLLAEHAADRLAAGAERLITGGLARLFARLFPAEKFAVERPCALPVGGQQFVPSDPAGRPAFGRRVLGRIAPLQQGKSRGLPVRDNCKPADSPRLPP